MSRCVAMSRFGSGPRKRIDPTAEPVENASLGGSCLNPVTMYLASIATSVSSM
jgi:hypothetical protein